MRLAVAASVPFATLRAMRLAATVFAGIAGIAGIAGTAPLARAHGRFPEAQQFLVHPTDPSVLGVSTTFGLVLSRDGGATWRWVCRAATEAGPNEDPVFAIASDGALLGAMFAGLVRSPDGCAWDRPEPALRDRVVYDLGRHPVAPTTFFALTSDGGGQLNALFRSDDDGLHWSPTSPPIAPILFERVRIAPSDPRTVYLSGATPRTALEPRRAYVLRSLDGGASWETRSFDLEGEEERNVRVLAVDPARPQVLFMRVVKDPGAHPERLVRSVDGGASWETILTPGEVSAAVFDARGTLWVGGRREVSFDGPDSGPLPPTHGLWRSDDGGETFTQVRADLSVGCLAWWDGALWACADNIRDGFALGRSTDGGQTFEPTLRFEEMSGPVECAPSSETATHCAATSADDDIATDLRVEGPPSSSGCGCATSGDAPGTLVALLPLAWCWARRRPV